jgi:hypothetical protein
MFFILLELFQAIVVTQADSKAEPSHSQNMVLSTGIDSVAGGGMISFLFK